MLIYALHECVCAAKVFVAFSPHPLTHRKFKRFALIKSVIFFFFTKEFFILFYLFFLDYIMIEEKERDFKETFIYSRIIQDHTYTDLISLFFAQLLISILSPLFSSIFYIAKNKKIMSLITFFPKKPIAQKFSLWIYEKRVTTALCANGRKWGGDNKRGPSSSSSSTAVDSYR